MVNQKEFNEIFDKTFGSVKLNHEVDSVQVIKEIREQTKEFTDKQIELAKAIGKSAGNVEFRENFDSVEAVKEVCGQRIVPCSYILTHHIWDKKTNDLSTEIVSVHSSKDGVVDKIKRLYGVDFEFSSSDYCCHIIRNDEYIEEFVDVERFRLED